MPINSRPLRGAGPPAYPAGGGRGARLPAGGAPIPGLLPQGSRPAGSDALFRDGESLDVAATAGAPSFIHGPIAGVASVTGAPTIATLTDDSGDIAGGDSVVIAGANFDRVLSVKFGTTAVTSYVVDSTTQITAVAPAHAVGAVGVVVATVHGTSAGKTYTYTDEE